jgi:Ribbon-helix-helix protein
MPVTGRIFAPNPDRMDTHCVTREEAMKDAGMRIRIEPELRQAFMTACRGQDLPAAQVIRAFIKDYVRKCEHTQGAVRTRTDAASGKARSNAAKPTALAVTKAPSQPT